MMIHHVSIGVRDVSAAADFYDRVLGTLGYKRVMEILPYAVAYGDTAPEFWIGQPHDQGSPSAGNGAHISFSAKNKSAIQKFHAAALEAGGSDEGAPGPRADYGPDYYGAFARDPDGNKIEAVLVSAPQAAKTAKPAAKKTSAKKAAPKKMKASRGKVSGGGRDETKSGRKRR
jgi:catechol 2,3-dioxygenase-like lactoylglutathione lyase family enzyme